MKKLIFTWLFLIPMLSFNSTAQEAESQENYGKTLNLGLGVAYYGYVGHSLAVFNMNYEIEAANYFTLAPFITVYSYQNYYYWGDNSNSYKNYYYRQLVIPIGVKGYYYFDKILNADLKWDFYLAGSIGFAIRKTTWENGYNGAMMDNRATGKLYFDGHIGAEYHINDKTGFFLDLSSGISTLGLAIHF